MAFIVADRVKETTTTTGTGTITLAGAATGYRTFSSTVGSGNTTHYVIVNSTGSEWEVGYGTMASGTTLARTRVYASSNAGAAVNFSAGSKDVFVTLSAAPANANTTWGTSQSFSPQTYSNNTLVGAYAASGGDGNTAVGYTATASGSDALAIGINSTASAFASVAVGRTSNASNVGATAVGPGAQASGSQAAAVGNDAIASGTGALAAGYGANASGSYGTALGFGSSALAASAPYDNAVVVGANSNTYGGITIGSGSSGSTKNGATIIGHGITPLQDDATYMNKFRTGVTPVGTAWTLTWDDSTQEVYAVPGATPTGANWYAYQSNGMTPALISIALPSGVPTTNNGGSTAFFSTQVTSSPPSGWSYSGSLGSGPYTYISDTYSYPISDPVTLGPSYGGFSMVYYAGYATDAGTTSTYQGYAGTGAYSGGSGSSFFGLGFPLFGTTRYGHAILFARGGDYTSSFTAGSGVTLVEAVYDPYYFGSYFFVDIDDSGVSNISMGGTIGSFSGTASDLYTTFWYNY